MRKDCERCRRPETSCVCRHLAAIDTAVEVTFLQHSREAKRRIGTAWLAHQALRGSRFLVGIDFAGEPEFEAALARPDAHLLFPGPTSVPIREVRFQAPPALLVPDGTWSQARKLVAANPRLAALPRLSIEPSSPSRFLLRRPPRPGWRSTLEAVVEALIGIEGAPERFETLLAALDSLVAERDLRRAGNDAGPRRRRRGATADRDASGARSTGRR